MFLTPSAAAHISLYCTLALYFRINYLVIMSEGKSSGEGKSAFEEKCFERVGDIAGRGRLRYLVCVDGSDEAQDAFNTIMKLRRKYDFVAVYHAIKEQDGSFVQPNWRPAAIQERYDVELTSRMLPERFSITMDQRGGRPFMETLTHALSQYEDSKLIRSMGGEYPDFVVFGYASSRMMLNNSRLFYCDVALLAARGRRMTGEPWVQML